MAERFSRPSDSDKLTFAASGGTKTDPGGSVRATGWVSEQIPGYDEFNWLQNLWGNFLDWYHSLQIREWSDVWEGIFNTTTEDYIFRVYHSTTGLRPRGLSQFLVTSPATGGGTVNQMCTDGEGLYFYGGTGNVYINRINTVNGSQEQEIGVGTGAVSAIDADGLYLYNHNTNSGVTGLRVRDRKSLANVRNGGSYYGCDLLRSNGLWCVGISPTGYNNYLVFYTGLQTTVTENAVATAATTLYSLAIDETQCYSGDGVAKVYAYTLTGTPVNNWTTTLPATTTAIVRCLAADGNVIYAGTEKLTLSGSAPASQSASGDAVIWALDRITGEVLWTRDLPDVAAQVDEIAVDQGYLYCYEVQDDSLFVFNLRAPEPSLVHVVTNWGDGGIAVDGVSVAGANTAGTSLRRDWFLRRGSQSFMRVLGQDSRRAPFFNLAIPID